MWSVGVVLYAALSGTLPYTEHEIQRIEEIVGNQDQLFGDARWREVSRDAIDLIVNNLLVVSADSRNRPNVKKSKKTKTKKSSRSIDFC